MNAKLTPGRWRGLKATSTSEHVFTIMAFDQRGSYAKMLPPDRQLRTRRRNQVRGRRSTFAVYQRRAAGR